jgi:hypothetical protein
MAAVNFVYDAKLTVRRPGVVNQRPQSRAPRPLAVPGAVAFTPGATTPYLIATKSGAKL